MATRPFIVASQDPDQPKRHFTSLSAAVLFAAKQAKQSWNGLAWTVRVKNSKVRIVVGVAGHFTVLDNGGDVGNGYLGSKNQVLMPVPVWDTIAYAVSAV